MGEILYVKKWTIYQKVHKLKGNGLNISNISFLLKVSRDTVYKYLEMDEENFYEFLENSKSKQSKGKKYNEVIREIIEKYEKISKKEVYDLLKLEYNVDVSYRTVCRLLDEII